MLMGDEVTVNDIDRALKWADRRDFLGNHIPVCPACDSRQVQLRDWVPVVAVWKCRVCKHKFNHEPESL